MLLGYAIGGLIAFLIMRQLGEMIVEEPVAGSFSHFAHTYWGRFAGFLSGWNYWVLYVLVGMAELTAIGKYVQFWWPEIPTWVTVLAFFLLINLINLANVRAFGEAEFWFSIIKVAAIVGMIVLGLYLLMSGRGGEQASVTNLWRHGGFFPHGFGSLVVTLPIIMFSFGGLELVGITAAEASDPRRVIPKAINQVVYRILIFYIGAIAVLLSLSSLGPAGGLAHRRRRPLQRQSLRAHLLAHRQRYGGTPAQPRRAHGGAVGLQQRRLLQQPHALRPGRTRRRPPRPHENQPLRCTGPGSGRLRAHHLLLRGGQLPPAAKRPGTLDVAGGGRLVINWTMISLTHLKFRRVLQQRHVTPAFKAFWSPLANYLCLAFVALPALSDARQPRTRASVIALPIWVGFMWLCYRLRLQVRTKEAV